MSTMPFLEESGYDIVLIQCHNENGGLSYSCCHVLSIFVSAFGSGVPRGGVFKPPPPEIPKIPVETSIAQARRTGVSISFCS